ncbi:MAG: NFACT family protein [Lachnospiraceae bacterium]|nr:NFACT family protein [Lachnospiraceae bacterium]
MAFDGVTVHALAYELNEVLSEGHISKIIQPESDELMLAVKVRGGGVRRLLISASASIPRIFLTEDKREAPATAPAFTMLLRKHLQGGRIIRIFQPSLERIINMDIEHRDEMGDLKTKTLIAEFMGKHSNIIFTDDEGTVIDSLKRVPSTVSSVREILPGRKYFIPETVVKADPLVDIKRDDFIAAVFAKSGNVMKSLYGSYTGISPSLATELCVRADIDPDMSTASAGVDKRFELFEVFKSMMSEIRSNVFSPCIIFENGKPLDFAVYETKMYGSLDVRNRDSVSETVEDFYRERDAYNKARTRSFDLRRIVTNAIERVSKKTDLQEKQLKSTEKADRYRLYGELINTYGYSVKDGSSYFEAEDFYTGETVRVPLDKDLSVHENANRYFDRYAKLKRTKEAASRQLEASRMELSHLQSVLSFLDMAESEQDLSQIREELLRTGYIRKRAEKGKSKGKCAPMHFISSDGFDIYVGRNNLQNDEVTFRIGGGSDWWFHAKKFPGSHVLMKTKGLAVEDIPDRAFNEAGHLAAFFSSAKDQEKVEIDYLQRRDVKKPAGAAPGYVIYYTNYSMAIEPDIRGIQKVSDTDSC